MERTIPSAILIKGISKEGLTNLLNDIEYAAIDEGLDVINEDAEKIIAIVRENKPSEETEEWVRRFKEQIAVLEKVTEENIGKIEILFERIFKDWEEYEKTNISVIDLEEVAKEENNDGTNEESSEENVVLEESVDKEIASEVIDENSNINETVEVEENSDNDITIEEPEVELEIDIPVDHIEDDEEKTEGEANE